jgi:hypothetical protein
VSQPLIDGVKRRGLEVVPDLRGRLTELLRRDDCFIERGQTYMTTMYPGVTKHEYLRYDEKQYGAR